MAWAKFAISFGAGAKSCLNQQPVTLVTTSTTHLTMPTPFKRHTITAALPYANGPVHIGHLAGVYIPADVYVRYLRMQGKEVVFICGSDEHGVPVTLRARKEGLTVQQVVDKYHKLIGDSFRDFGISFDIYHRTSDPVHHATSQELFRTLHERGELVALESEQFYDETAQQFLADRYIQGTCPVCGFENAYGDQCENCGSTLSPQELKNPRSMLSGAAPIMKATTHWYLPLDKWEGALRNYILDEHKADWKTNVLGQCKSWLDQGLQPRAVTRDLDWGVPVPLPNSDGKVLYVWFDAPIGYISATKAWAEEKGKNWEDYWKSPEAEVVHFIGKDNIVFHCIIFPVMLMAAGKDSNGNHYQWANQVPANEFLNLEGNKISTSRNWAVWLHEYLQDLPGKQDVLRYVLMANMPETKDNDFTWRDFQARNNNELVAILGNYVNRVITLTHKYFEGKVPVAGPMQEADLALVEAIKAAPADVSKSLNQYRFREALSLMMDVARAGNKHLADTEPWKLWKTEPNRVATILNLGLQVCANLQAYCQVFLPQTAEAIQSMLGTAGYTWEDLGRMDLVPAGSQIGPAILLFEKLDDAFVDAQVAKLEATKLQNELAARQPEPAKEAISFDDFGTMDIRVATILEAEAVPKTKKLLKLTLDTGIDKRTVVSGIAEHYKPEEIIGQQVCLLANLAPRDLKGITSQGMILMAEDRDGKLRFVQPSAAVWNGAVVK